MKSLGKFTMRGTVDPGSTTLGVTKQIRLFEGSFATAYRITKFEVFGADPDNATNDVYSMLLTENMYDGTDALWNADDVRQIGWASWASVYSEAGSPSQPFNLVDRDNLIVQDLWIYMRSGSSSTAGNYYIELEKFNVGLDTGSYTMVRNAAQDFPSGD